MVVLKKLKAASLVETLTATVIIIVVFMIASISFNTVFLNTIKSDDIFLKNRLEEITYFIQHDKLELPFYEEGTYWVISGEKRRDKVVFEIENTRQEKLPINNTSGLNNNRKIKAFTLTEMLVVIVISAIVVGIAFTVLILVQQNYNRINALTTILSLKINMIFHRIIHQTS